MARPQVGHDPHTGKPLICAGIVRDEDHRVRRAAECVGHAVEDAPSSHQFKPFRLAPHAHGAPTREDGSRAPARRHPVASQVALSVSSSATVTSRTVAVAPAAVSAAWTCAAMTPATSSHVGMRRPGWNSGASLSEVP